MPFVKKVLYSLLAVSVVMGGFSPLSQAAEPEKKEQAANGVPIVVEADEINFSDLSGEMSAKGNVVIVQDQAQMSGDFVRGNTKSSDVWVDGDATLRQPGMDIVGSVAHYNYSKRTGTMEKVAGQVDKQRITGKNIEIMPQEVILRDGTVTRCPAKKPDYHMSASKVEIWPGDHMVAYNVKFWIKDTVIFSLPSYRASLQPNAAESSFPRVKFSSGSGSSIRQHLETPIGDKVSVYTDLAYYSKAGYKPVYGVVDHENGYEIGVATGHYLDSDDNWIKKEPEFTLKFASHQLGSLPVNYTIGASYGKWLDSAKSSWHQSYDIYFSHFPIKMNTRSTLNLGTGFTHTHDSYDQSSTDKYRYDGTVTTQWSPKFSTMAGYHYISNTQSVFSYDSDDMNRELDFGFKWQIDRMNGFGITERYDAGNSQKYEVDYTWYRNLHCWDGTITYRSKKDSHSWKLDVAVKRF